MKEKTKGFIAGALAATTIFGAGIGVSADSLQKAATLIYNNIKICIDGNYIEPKDANGNKVEPFIIDGTTYLPVRAVASALGKEVAWDGNTNTVFLGAKPEQKTTVAKNDVIFEDDKFKITYVDFQDPNHGVTTFNLFLKIENKTETEITAMLTDGYANDTSIFFMTGMPVTIASGKNAVGPFIFGYNNLGINGIQDIKKLEFKFTARDSKTFDVIYETESFELNF